MGKDKTPKKMEVDDEEEEEQQVVLSVIAQPLAKDKLVKKVLKLVKTGECTANRSCIFFVRWTQLLLPLRCLAPQPPRTPRIARRSIRDPAPHGNRHPRFSPPGSHGLSHDQRRVFKLVAPSSRIAWRSALMYDRHSGEL